MLVVVKERAASEALELFERGPRTYELGSAAWPHGSSRPSVWDERLVAQGEAPTGSPIDEEETDVRAEIG